jgi:hypothetical protein
MNRSDTDDRGLNWDEHCHWQFVLEGVDKTMSTMAAKPYVNHIPARTAGR